MTMLQAIQFAAEVHRNDVRKFTGEPYIYHCLRVMNEVVLHPLTQGMKYAMAAVCHDTIEDHPDVADYDKVAAAIGVEATIVVGELTNRYTSDQYPQCNRATRKRMERDRLSACSDPVKVIKLFDRLDNIKSFDLGQMWKLDPKERKKALAFAKVYAEETMKLVAALRSADPALAAILEEESEALGGNGHTDY